MIDLLAIITSFKGLNLIVVIAVIIYLTKKKLIPIIDDLQRKEENATQTIKNEQKNLNHEYEEMQETLTIQKIYGQDLLKKIEQWNNVLQKKEQQENTVEYERQKKNIALQQKQQESLTAYLFYKEVSPYIAQEVRNNVMQDFKKNNLQQKFLDNACDFIKEQL